MGEEAYFIISNSDGDTHVRMLTKAEMAERLKEDAENGDNSCDIYFDEMPLKSDTNYWANDGGDTVSLIIKGRVVSPKPKNRVTEYEID